MRAARFAVLLVACGGRTGLSQGSLAAEAGVDAPSPDVVTPPPSGNCASAMVTLASANGGDAIAVDSNFVYWHASTGISRVPKTGGAAQLVVPMKAVVWPLLASFIVVQNRIYYWQLDGVHAAQPDGSNDELIAQIPIQSAGGVSPGVPSADPLGDYFAWPEEGMMTSIYDLPLMGGGFGPFANMPPPAAIAATSVVYAAIFDGFNDGLWIVNHAAPAQRLTTTGAVNVVTDQTTLFVAAGNVLSMPVGGTSPTKLAGAADAWGLALDDDTVYFTDRSAGIIAKVPKTGGAQTTLATTTDEAMGIAVDAQCVYAVLAGPSSGSVIANPK